MLGAWAGHVVAAPDARRAWTRPRPAAARMPLAVVMVALTTLTLWSLGQAIVITPEETPVTARRSTRRSRPVRIPPGRHPLVERADLGPARRDRRVERLRGRDRGLDRGQAEDPLRGRRQADLGRVADRAGARRRRVDDEPDLARRDEVEDRDLAVAGGLAELGDRAGPRSRPRERRARARRRREAVAGRRQRRREPRQQLLVAVGDRQQRQRPAARPRPRRTSAAPSSALAIATRGSSWMPMTSPVDCMPGPTDGSTPRSLAVENAGALTATKGGGGSRAAVPAELAASVAPSAIRTASSTIGTPVTLDRNGTVREARGLTSMRYTPSSRTMNWALTRPFAPSASTIRSIVATISAWSPSLTVCGGNTPTESPEWTPARSTCSSSPGISTSLAVGDRVDVDLDALEVAVDAHRPVRVDDRGRRELAEQVLGRVAEVDREAADDERGRTMTG